MRPPDFKESGERKSHNVPVELAYCVLQVEYVTCAFDGL